nr:hypothetical protein [Natrinema pellirubrum]
MVATISVGILLVAGDVMTSTEQQAESERVEQAFVELSKQMATVSKDGDAPKSMTFDAGQKGAVTRTATGEITIKARNVNETLTMGSIEYEGDDGSIVAYQAGGVWRETGNQTRMISQPSIAYSAEEQTLSLPVTTVSGERELSSGEVDIRHNGTDPVRNTTVVEDDTVTLEITSKYYRGWELYFEEEVGDASVRNVTQLEGDKGYVKVELGLRDLEGAFNTGVAVSEEDGYDVGGNPNSVDGVQSGTSYPEIGDVIRDLVERHSGNNETKNWSDVETDLSSETYYADGDVTVDDEVEFTLTEGDATLIINGSLNVNSGGLSVDSNGTDNVLKIYTTENVKISGGEVASDGGSAKNIQLYGTPDMSFFMGGGTFEGVVYAPSNDWDGTNEVANGNCDVGSVGDAQACLRSNPDFTGSIVTSSVYVQGGGGNGEDKDKDKNKDNKGNLNFNWDPELKGYGPSVYPEEGYVLPPNITHLNVAVHTLDVKNK